jgi:hypothetical protein
VLTRHPLPRLVQMSYLDKPWFGAVPPYLQKRMREIEEQRARVEQQQQANQVTCPPGIKPHFLTPSRRLPLVQSSPCQRASGSGRGMPTKSMPYQQPTPRVVLCRRTRM